MTTSIISGTKMSSFAFCLLFFVSVGLVKSQEWAFPNESDFFPSYRNHGGVSSSDARAGANSYNGRSDANAEAKTQNAFGRTNANSNARTSGKNGHSNSYSDAEINNDGVSANAGSNSGTNGPYGQSGSDARANTYVDKYGNAQAKSESHARSGYGHSGAASASATTGLNNFGEPVGAVATGTAYAGPDGASNAMSGSTVIGGNNHRQRDYRPNNHQQNYDVPYPYGGGRPFFGSRSGAEDDDDSKAQPEAH